MSDKSDKTSKTSDDDFQDAISDVPIHGEGDASVAGSDGHNFTGAAAQPKNTNERTIDELTQQQADLQLGEDEENGAAGAATDGESAATPELLTDDISEEELQAREKTLSDDELRQNKAEADRMKLEGNELFKNDDSMRAIEIYTEALGICPTTHPKDRAILFGNRAAAKIKIDSKKSAVDDCTRAIQLWPDYVRALLRRAKLYETDEKYEEALEDYKRVYDLDPGQREAREAISRLPSMINERNERLKTEMMSKLKDLGNMFLKPFGLSTSNFQMAQDPNTGSYSVNFQQGPR